jgi:hypothetical protein
MARTPLLLLIATGLLCIATPAWAVPAPLSPADLLARSDLAALVRVLSVTCAEKWLDPGSGEVLRAYLADLRVLKVRKGSARRSATVRVRWQDIPAGLLGPWSVGYLVGEELWTHLVRGSGAEYDSTWWNARGDLLRGAERTDLPREPGETFTATASPGRARFSLASLLRDVMGRG